jgi:hypothetical protein
VKDMYRISQCNKKTCAMRKREDGQNPIATRQTVGSKGEGTMSSRVEESSENVVMTPVYRHSEARNHN